MLCPEVTDFPPPKVISFCKQRESLDYVLKTINMNNFYKSVIVTCPDELVTPSVIEEAITEDAEYYKVAECSLVEFLEPSFTQNFVQRGKLYCLSANRNCIIQNCAALTPNGVMTIHLLEYIYQTIGLEGAKRPFGFYEVTVDLKNLKRLGKLRLSLEKLELFDFYITWVPDQNNVCPSSIAKYFFDRNIKVAVESLQVSKLTPFITEVPSLRDTEPDEMTEWIGMLAHEGDLSPKETYISTYGQPESDYALKTNRISMLIVKGLITPISISNLCKSMFEYVKSRELDDYWTSISIQSNENSLWRWNASTPPMFQSHDCSCNIFFRKDSHTIYSVGQIKYS